ncbi:unnamed protein product [Mytilus coruscus]|uniref:Uncharacterized protein n=1 Tax=Mytilus coruscus TaxID=42192 RepID=A0A6J8C5H4_MYTCO|nr:unnamed protein product [Mytilus coruscus]
MEPEEYADKFSSTVTNGFIALEIAIGLKLGLFNSLNTFTSQVTSKELAVSCKLKERYVREWLGCLSAAGFVCITPDDKYFIPEACKPHTESNTISNVLDFGCGPGCLTIKLAEHLPKAKVYGIDIDRNSIEKAKEKKAKENIPNVEFVLLENDHLDESWTKKFDWITMVDVLHDLPNPNLSISDIKRILKDDGIVSLIDPCVHSDHKMNLGNQSAAMLYVFSTFLRLPCSMSREPAAANGSAE